MPAAGSVSSGETVLSRPAFPSRRCDDATRHRRGDAAHQLGVPIERSVVFEDALSGVKAGHDGHFGLVVGVDRGVGPDRLAAAGADLVVRDLAELIPS